MLIRLAASKVALLAVAGRAILVRAFWQAAFGIRRGLPTDELSWQPLEQVLAKWDRQ